MKLSVLATLCGLFCAAPVQAQVVDAGVCDVVNHPARFDGKIVRIKGVVQVGFDSFLVRGDTCSSPLWLSYPAGSRAKSGPVAVLTLQLAANAAGTPGKIRPAVQLERSKDFDQFDTLLSQKVKTPGMCLGCVKNNVQATLVGRIDGSENTGITRDSSGKITALDGFGNLNAYPARLVLQSVTGVTAQEIDYSKAPKVKDDTPGGNDKDYLGLTRKAEAAFPKGSEAAGQIEKAIAALGAPGVDNGVTVAFGATAEVPDGEGIKSAKQSPDGVLYTLRFDMDRLRGDSLSRAIAHEGAEVAAMRDSGSKGFQAVEHEAWQTTLLTTIGARQKTLMLPGGTVLWDESWPEAQRTANASSALTSYLDDHEQSPH